MFAKGSREVLPEKQHGAWSWRGGGRVAGWVDVERTRRDRVRIIKHVTCVDHSLVFGEYTSDGTCSATNILYSVAIA